MTHPTIPDAAMRIISNIGGRAGFIPDELLGSDKSRETRAVRASVIRVLCEDYGANTVAGWFGRVVKPVQVTVAPKAVEFPKGGLSLWKGFVPTNRSGRSMATIAEMVAESYGVSLEAMKGPSRTKDITVPRQHAMWSMSEFGHGISAIGRFFSRDHTTALHGIRAHQRRTDQLLQPEAAQLAGDHEARMGEREAA